MNGDWLKYLSNAPFSDLESRMGRAVEEISTLIGKCEFHNAQY